MLVETVRFGRLDIPNEKIVTFPQGLPGFDTLVRWCLLHQGELLAINWLQSVEDPEVALLIADPESLFADYNVSIDVKDLAPIGVNPQAHDKAAPPIVLRVVISVDRAAGTLTANLAAPILINVETNLAMQMPLLDTPYSMRQPVPVPEKPAAASAGAAPAARLSVDASAVTNRTP